MSIDQGTTSSRAIIVNHDGQIVGKSQAEFKQFYPQAGWVEHDPNLIWNNVQQVIAGAFIDSEIHPKQILAIGITNQRETTVVWNRHTGKPIYNAIVWQSRQTAAIADLLIKEGHQELIQNKTGLVIDAYFSATKIRWILDHVEGAQAQAEAGDLIFGTIDSWLLFKLTGGEVHNTDYTNASRTMLFNIHTLDWDQDILNILNIPRSMMPEVKSSSEYLGKTKSYLFFDYEIPITAMAGDQQAALFGQLAFEPGMVKSTYGTGSFIIANLGSDIYLSQHNLLTTIAYVINGEVTYALEGSIFVAGSAVQWLRDGLELIKDSAETEVLALHSGNTDQVYLVPAFTGLGAPYWNSNARGSLFGLTRGTSKADLAKATLQSIAYQVNDIIDTMRLDSEIEIKELRVDGGASMNEFLMQFQADITGVKLTRAKNLETTSLGAAYLAGLGIGFWKDREDLLRFVSTGDKYESKMTDIDREKLIKGWKRAVKATEFYAQLVQDDQSE
ncbi:glycerol kinase GlpK [Fundicoccus sp. Sow4_H7]|uniref:glycerol kinase GlpK n=1 Tax=Fundicoccus sp. Sow4_H7 TaxID=3438784 RepID=UPI003F904653